jgi:hypothetical protein
VKARTHLSIRPDVNQVDRDEEHQEGQRYRPGMLRVPVLEDDLSGGEVGSGRDGVIDDVAVSRNRSIRRRERMKKEKKGRTSSRW